MNLLKSATAALRGASPMAEAQGGAPPPSGSGIVPIAAPASGGLMAASASVGSGHARPEASRMGLPPAAVAKLTAWQDLKEEAFALARHANDKMQDVTAELRHHEQEVAALVSPRGYQRSDPGSIALAEQRRDVAREKVRARRERADEAAARAQAIGGPLQEVERWIDRQARRGVRFEPFRGTVAPQLRKGETVPEAVERTRAEIAQRKAELHRIKLAPVPAAEARAAIRHEIERLAEAGAPDLERVLHSGPIRWPTIDRHTELAGQRVPDGPHHLAVMAWLHKPTLLARLDEELAAIADDTTALSAEQRAAEDARVRSELLALERVEEALLESAPPGLTIHRRPDADPRAVLGLADDLPGPEAR